MVLFSVCPLKFLFSLWLGSGPHRTHIDSADQLRQLPGYIYFLLAPLLALNGWWHGRLARLLLERERTGPLAA